MLESFRAHLNPRALGSAGAHRPESAAPRPLRSVRAAAWTGLKRLHATAEVVVYGPLFFLGLLQLATPAALGALPSPGFVAGSVFASLAGLALLTRWDFSFLRAPLALATAAATLLFVGSALLARPLGPLFAYAMVACAVLSTLEQSAAARRGWRPLPHVGPALRLLARPTFAPVPVVVTGLVRLSRLGFAPLERLHETLRVLSFPRTLPDGLRRDAASR